MSSYVTSDIHFSHVNIAKYYPVTRPGNTIQEVDQHIIDAWNQTVKPSDTVYHLGDFTFMRSVTEIYNLIQSLNGKIVFIKGNHDGQKFINAVSALPEKCTLHDYLEIDLTGTKVCLFHFPMESWHGMYRQAGTHKQSVHLHGHQHGGGRKMAGRLDCGWDAHGRILRMEEAVNFARSAA